MVHIEKDLASEARAAACLLIEVCLDSYSSPRADYRAYARAQQYLVAAAREFDILLPLRRTGVHRPGVSRGLQRMVWDRDGWECRHCGSHRDLTVDHILPLAKGGTNYFANLQTLCMTCNTKKNVHLNTHLANAGTEEDWE